MPRSFLFFAFATLFVFSSISIESFAEDYPAVFETKFGPISTIDQYKNRVLSLYSDLEHEFIEGESVQYNNLNLEAMIFTTKGLLNGDKHEQKLTYGEISPGLWKLIYLEAESCIMRTLTHDGVSTEQWICEELWHPIAGGLADIYLVDSDDLDLSVLSEAIGNEVTLYTPSEPEDEEVLQNLEQIKSIILDSGATWEEEETVWNGFGGQGPDQPAIQIRVTGQPSDKVKFDQTFVYFYKDDQMILGSIDGQVCEFIDRVDRFICEDVYNSTEYTPFPYVLTTNEVDVNLDDDLVVDESSHPLRLSCGSLDQNYSMLLRFHFERGSFELYEIEGFRKALSNITEVLDPEALLLSERDKSVFERINQPPFLFSEQVDELAQAIRLGAEGECGSLVDLTEDLFLTLEESIFDVEEFLSNVERHGVTGAAFLNDEHDLVLWSWVLEKASELSFFEASKSAAIDVALGMLEQYISDANSFSQNVELLMTAAFFKEDAYSYLIKEKDFLTMTQSQVSQGPYFGLSVIKGLSAHYVYSVHPQTQSDYSFSPGDEIVQINNQEADALSSKEVDDFLLNTDSPLSLTLRQSGELSTKELRATHLDLVQMSYSWSETDKDDVYKLKLNNFTIGMVDRVFQILKPLVDQNNIKGLIVDLSENKGGDTEEARRFLSLFIESGPLFHYKIGPRRSAVLPEALMPSAEYFVSSDIPLVVITSDQTMSAAEIVSSSLKGHKRALLIGGRTFGKFVGQRIFPVILSDQMQVGLNVTVAEFFSPSGKALNGLGVEPDIKTLDSRPAFQDGNPLGVDMANVEPLVGQESFLTGLNIENLELEAQSLILNNNAIDLALLAIDQSQKDTVASAEVVTGVGDLD